MRRLTTIGLVLLLTPCFVILTSCGSAATVTPELTATPAATATPTTAPPALPTPTLASGGVPASYEEIQRLSPEELKALIESGADIVVVDNQPEGAYEMGHIPGAVNFPWAMEITGPGDLPKDKLLNSWLLSLLVGRTMATPPFFLHGAIQGRRYPRRSSCRPIGTS